MKKLAEYIKWYLYITTCILIVCTIIVVGVYKLETIPTDMLWQILVSGLLTTGVTVLTKMANCTTRKSFILHMFFHYAALCVVMIICGKWFGWMQFDMAGVIMMMVAVAVVYLLCIGAYSLIDQRQANDINRILKEKYGEE